MVRFSHVCGMMQAVCFIVFLKSCVSCQALAQGLQENSTLTDLNLGFNNISDEGAKAWCSVRIVSWGERRSEEIQKGRIKTCRTSVDCSNSKEGSRHYWKQTSFNDRSLASNRQICNINNILVVPCIIESDNAVQRWFSDLPRHVCDPNLSELEIVLLIKTIKFLSTFQ